LNVLTAKVKMNKSISKLHIFLLTSLFGVLVWSMVKPHDYFTWFLEVLPAVLAVAIFAFFYRRFRFTNLVYTIVWFHCIVLIVGGKYTYAEMPLFDYFKEVFGWSRNNYDKVGHFMQGFSPALIVREVFIRKNIINGKWWTLFLAVCVPLAFSAFYEFVEWWVAVATGDSAEAFLGTQGYQWDTQTDMFICLIGSGLALLFLSAWQDKQMNRMNSND
jgi:putative membrane protein